MADYKKLSEYPVNTTPGPGDLIPSIVDNGGGSYSNVNIPFSALKGEPGNDGSNGTNGQGVPTGGTTSQVLQKASNANYDTQWVTMSLTKAAVGLGNVDNTSDVNKPVSTATQSAINSAVSAAILQAKTEAYPVGSMYFNATVATNPATLLGFGTWSAYGQGQVPVGKAASGTFATAGATGGEESHVLTVNEMPSHTHGQKVTANTGPSTRRDFVADGGGGEYDQGVQTYAAGGGAAHNNLQPYIVVYIWRRTA